MNESTVSSSQITEGSPADLFALKRAQLVAFCIGDQQAMLDVAVNVEDACKVSKYPRSTI